MVLNSVHPEPDRGPGCIGVALYCSLGIAAGWGEFHLLLWTGPPAVLFGAGETLVSLLISRMVYRTGAGRPLQHAQDYAVQATPGGLTPVYMRMASAERRPRVHTSY